MGQKKNKFLRVPETEGISSYLLDFSQEPSAGVHEKEGRQEKTPEKAFLSKGNLEVMITCGTDRKYTSDYDSSLIYATAVLL